MRKRWFLTWLFLAAICFNITAQEKRGSDDVGGGAVEIIDARVTKVGKQWAVFIAIDEYKEIEPLFYPVKDAREIKKILSDHYYIDEVKELYNRDATAAAIRNLFVELQREVAYNDSVFVFQAGHGVDDDATKTSAWMAYDASADSKKQDAWLSHTQIRSMLDGLQARHVFLISDSCYAGALLDQNRGRANEIVLDYPAAYNNVSRQAMSSGAIEKVADESEFASRLKSILLRTETPYVTPLFLCSQIIETKTKRELYTVPVLAAIPQSSHQVGGNFLFFRKNPTKQQPTIEAVNVKQEQLLSPEDSQPGKPGYFVGSWVADVEYNGSFDTYEITFSANGRCTVRVENDTAQQETTGRWSFDGTYFELSATFRNAKIAYRRNIDWKSIVGYSGGNSFNILAKAATDAPHNIRFTFFRDN